MSGSENRPLGTFCCPAREAGKATVPRPNGLHGVRLGRDANRLVRTRMPG